MRREITAFLQHCVCHFCCIHKIIISVTRPGSAVRCIFLNHNLTIKQQGRSAVQIQ